MKFTSEPPACNFRNERIEFTNDSYAKIVSYWMTKIFVALMLLANLAVLGPMLLSFIHKPSPTPLLFVMLAIVSIPDIFILKMLGIVGNVRRKYLFDLRMKVFYPNGRKITGLDTERYNTAGGVSFNDIEVMYIASKHVCTSKSSYTSYALTLVLRNGTNYVLLNHSNINAIMNDAQRLSQLGGIRLVDKYKPTSTQDVTSENPWSKNYKKQQSLVGVFLFGGIFLAVGCFVIIAFTVRPLFNWSRSAHWMETEAVVISSELGHSRGSKGKATYRVNITFQYRINEHTYTSEKYDFFMSDLYTNIGVKAMRRAVDRHHPGDVVTCYVNPDNPKQAIISREIHCGLLILTSIFGLIFGGVGIAIILGNIKFPKK